MRVPFATPFDEAIARSGVAALFTADHRGELRLTSDRSRDVWNLLTGPPRPGWAHCLYRDRGTGFVQYVLATSPDLCASHPRADIRVYADQDSALAALEAWGRPPIAAEPWPEAAPPLSPPEAAPPAPPVG